MVRVEVFIVVLLAAIFHQNEAFPAEIMESPLGQTANLEANIAYLRKYDYLPEASDQGDSLLKVVDIEQAVRRLQKYGGITETGTFDAETVELMETPRCGVPDPAGVSERTGQALGGALQKRYAHTGGKWEKLTLTYRILNTAGSGLISGTESDDAIRAAFKIWSDVTPLVFEEKFSGYADIYLKFGPYHHGDQYPFDGPGYTLAHAYPPMSGFGDLDGDVHFDDSERYTLGTVDGINLFQVAAHEIGHALGLAHSDVTGALMQPFYQGYIPNYSLPYDDTYGIQLLYGSQPATDAGPGPEEPLATTPKPKPGVTTKPETPTAGCNGLVFNAIGYIRSELFAFKEDRYWRIRTPKQLLTSIEGDETKYFWFDLPPSIDASYERRYDQRILFFKGDKYWEYNGLNKLTGFPKLIKELTPTGTQLPINIDAILTYDEYSKTYFFKGDQVWRYDDTTRSVDEGWPYTIAEVFPGVPSNLNAAFRYKDDIPIFVKGTQYYSFDEVTVRAESAKSFGVDFLGCKPDALGGDGDNDGNGNNGVSSTTPTLLGVVLGSLVMFLNQLW